MSMQAGVLLMGCLLALYLVAMVMFWHGSRGHQHAEPRRMAGRLTLREGQTILGVMDTPALRCFCLGTSEEPVQQEEETGP